MIKNSQSIVQIFDVLNKRHDSAGSNQDIRGRRCNDTSLAL